MTRVIPILSLLLSSCFLPDINQAANQSIKPSQQEVASGLKNALKLGVGNGAEKLSQKNGYFGDASLKIPFPEQAVKVENSLRDLGLNQLCDDLVLSLNRAAESAALEAKPIFISAVQEMTFSDAMNILFGSKHAATDYLREKTLENLHDSFKPVIESHLQSAHATKYWSNVMNQYNRIPFITPVETDLPHYVTKKATAGLFHMVSLEEEKIRSNPIHRTTQLLQKVFGYADSQSENKN